MAKQLITNLHSIKVLYGAAGPKQNLIASNVYLNFTTEADADAFGDKLYRMEPRLFTFFVSKTFPCLIDEQPFYYLDLHLGFGDTNVGRYANTILDFLYERFDLPRRVSVFNPLTDTTHDISIEQRHWIGLTHHKFLEFCDMYDSQRTESLLALQTLLCTMSQLDVKVELNVVRKAREFELVCSDDLSAKQLKSKLFLMALESDLSGSISFIDIKDAAGGIHGNRFILKINSQEAKIALEAAMLRVKDDAQMTPYASSSSIV